MVNPFGVCMVFVLNPDDTCYNLSNPSDKYT
jgi:hypothetical protein